MVKSPPHQPCREPSPQGRRFFFAFRNVDSATPGKPCVQNDMRGERKIHECLLNSVLVNEALKKMDDLIPQDLIHLTVFFQKCSQLIQFPFPGLVEGFRNFKVFSRNPI